LFYRNEMKSVREQTQTTHEEALKNKEDELNHMSERFNQLQNEIQKNSDNTNSAEAEELRTLKIAYEKMVAVKDKEIKEVEERLQEMIGSDKNRSRNEVGPNVYICAYLVYNNDQIST
jgi:uncharacterized protein YdcH (DUF465 family)